MRLQQIWHRKKQNKNDMVINHYHAFQILLYYMSSVYNT